MAKYNIDDILKELGVGAKPGDPTPVAKPVKHSVDQAAEAFSPIPAVPAHQGPAKASETAPTPTPSPEDKELAKALSNPLTPVASAAILPNPAHRGQDVGQLLVLRGELTPDKLANAQNVLKTSPGKKICEILLEQGADEVSVQKALAESEGLPFERIDLEKGLEGGFDGTMLQRLGADFCKRHMVVPLRTEGQRVVIGATTGDNVFLIDEIKQKLGVASVKLVLVTPFDVKGVLEIVGESTQETPNVEEILEEVGVGEGDVQLEKASSQEVDLEKQAGEGPVIRYVNYIIQQAVKEGASDIHIEPAEKKLRVRFRIDGELFEMMNPPASMSAAITSRLKIMGNLDISERRIPQDGRIRCVVGGRKLDLRMSTLPNGYGEKTVMRILDTRSINVELDQLGFDENTLTIWKQAIDSPHGIVLVTGPTGSGKTTTLYASLRTLDKNTMNICTVEDPVEYHLEGLTQTQMHEKIGMTFALALRALLRQDPDVVMLGEIRDQETAHIAVQAALTGHLVLSTLHTNDAPSSVTRLVNIGLEPFLVGAAVNAVVAQRLIRKLCKECRKMEKPTDDMAEFLASQGCDTDEMWMSKGCDKCRKTGFSGRVGIYELLSVDDQLRDIIARNPNVSEFRRLCQERGMVTLREDGMKKVAMGLTTVSEVLRVTAAH